MSTQDFDPQQIAALSPEMLAVIPAWPAPPGVVPNYENPATRVPVILGVSISFLVLASLCFLVRVYTKSFIVKKLYWDDLFCSLGFAFSVVYFTAVVIGCDKGAPGRHIWDVHLNQILGPGALYNYVTTAMVTPGLGFIKSTLFIQYYMLFKPLRWMRICVWIGFTVSSLFYVPVSIIGFIFNSPWPGKTFLENILSWHYLVFARFSIPTGVIGVLVDWYLLILPIPAVMGLHMSLAKKLGVLLIFMTGAAAAAASTACLYFRVQLAGTFYTDVTWAVGYVLLLTQIEMFAGVAVCSMPSVHKFFAEKKSVFVTWSNASRTGSQHLMASISRRRPSEGNSIPSEPEHEDSAGYRMDYVKANQWSNSPA